MARFYLFPFRTLILLCVCAVSFSLAQAQIANLADDTSTPIPGAGHDYIHAFSETVNPANGSVSLRIEVPMPKGRGITLPFSFGYDSNSVHHLLPGYYPSYGTVNWVSNTGYLAQGGWSYALPGAGNFEANVTEGNYPVFFNCSVYTNYMFRDASGGLHALALLTAISNGSNPCIEEPVASGGDPQLSATLPTSPGSPPSSGGLSVFTADGTIYKFSSLGNGGPGGESFALPISVEDRNGNVINVTDNGNGNFFFTDTAGRTAISSNGFGPTGATNTLSFSGFTYQVTWKTISANFPAPPTTWVGQQGGPNEFDTCSPIPAGNDSQTVISQITLPNGKQYKFYYGADNPNGSQYQNPYGLLSEIDYPSGAWVRYKWKLSDNANELADYPGLINAGASTCSTDPTAFCPAPVPDGCLYQYQTPVVASREVGFGGSPSAALTQTFSYSTTWGSPSTSWTQKSTSVTTIDNILGKSLLTTYSYSPIPTPIEPNVHSSIPGQIPVESSVSYYDWG